MNGTVEKDRGEEEGWEEREREMEKGVAVIIGEGRSTKRGRAKETRRG